MILNFQVVSRKHMGWSVIFYSKYIIRDTANSAACVVPLLGSGQRTNLYVLFQFFVVISVQIPV